MDTDFPAQFKQYMRFCEYRNRALASGKLDLSGCNWIYPTTLLPLSVFIKESQKKVVVCWPSDEKVHRYFSTILGAKKDLKEKTYLPVVELPHKEGDADEMMKKLYELHADGKEYGGESAFKYVIGELMDNIYQHSCFDNAFVMAQRYSNKHFAEICLFDDGITIPGSLKKAGAVFGPDEHHFAIANAINGLSAKSSIERGFGLGSDIKLVTKGLKGEFLVVSGFGAVYVGKDGLKLFKLQEPHSLRGTLVSIRFAYPAKEVNIYEFIEARKN